MSTSHAALLEISDLKVEFPTRRGTLVAVNGVTFNIEPGEVLGLVGESGAGKSMTGNAIIGLLEAPGRIAGGTIVLDGRRIDDLPYEEMRKIRGREIGAIFQDPLTSLNPLYTIERQLVETMMTHLDVSRGQARERAIELLHEVGIPSAGERIHHYPHQFSGGMRQRVVIAIALACGPELVIADEPTTALDVTIQAQILDLMKSLQRDLGMSIILITHDLGVIAETCDEVCVMYAGRVVERGDAKELFANPRHAYTQGLLSSIPRLNGVPKSRLTTIDGMVPALNELRPGCRFCPRSEGDYEPHHLEVRPDFVEISSGHWVEACPVCT